MEKKNKERNGKWEGRKERRKEGRKETGFFFPINCHYHI